MKYFRMIRMCWSELSGLKELIDWLIDWYNFFYKFTLIDCQAFISGRFMAYVCYYVLYLLFLDIFGVSLNFVVLDIEFILLPIGDLMLSCNAFVFSYSFSLISSGISYLQLFIYSRSSKFFSNTFLTSLNNFGFFLCFSWWGGGESWSRLEIISWAFGE